MKNKKKKGWIQRKKINTRTHTERKRERKNTVIWSIFIACFVATSVKQSFGADVTLCAWMCHWWQFISPALHCLYVSILFFFFFWFCFMQIYFLRKLCWTGMNQWIRFFFFLVGYVSTDDDDFFVCSVWSFMIHIMDRMSVA